MGKLGFLLNGVLVSGVVSVLFLGAEGVASPVLDAPLGGDSSKSDLSALESSVAIQPEARNVTELATAYLDRQQPGLAQAALDRLPESAPDSAAATSADSAAEASLLYVRSRVALAQGRGSDALAFSRTALSACERPGAACQGGLYAKTLHQIAWLEAMTDAGVQDPAAEPDRARNAMEGAVREVRLVANQ